VIITVKCENCGFGYTLFTDDESILDELKLCECGAETVIEVKINSEGKDKNV